MVSMMDQMIQSECKPLCSCGKSPRTEVPLDTQRKVNRMLKVSEPDRTWLKTEAKLRNIVPYLMNQQCHKVPPSIRRVLCSELVGVVGTTLASKIVN